MFISRLRNDKSRPTDPHFYVGYSFYNLFLWKIGVLRRFLGDLRRLPIIKVIALSKRNNRFKIQGTKPAIICGTGPSILEIDETFLMNFSSTGAIFSVNHFPITKKGLHLKIDYQILMDNYHFRETPDDPAEIKFRKWLKSEFHGTVITKIGAELEFTGARIELNGLSLPTYTKSINPMGIVGFQPYTALFAVSTALWLGYSPIYLIGIDASQHSKILVDKDSVKLDRHHAYNAHLDNLTWKGRPNVTSVLNSNAYFIEQCKLFSDSEVYLIDSSSHVDTLPRVNQKDLR